MAAGTSTNIVFLWAEVTGYVLSLLEELVVSQGARIDVVHWDRKKVNSTRFAIETAASIHFHGRSRNDEDAIYKLLCEKQPKIIVVSGWMDKGYIRASKKYKRMHKGVRVVAGIDDQWKGTQRQRLGQIYYRLVYRALFDYLWVSGKPQYSYAQRFGYGIDSIVSNLYSADTKLFKKAAQVSRRFVFVGRFDPVKALDILIDAYCELPREVQQQWPLHLIGDGEHKEMILARNNPNIVVLPFMQPAELRDNLNKGGIGCLTSHQDQWGVVIHEYALMGFPLLLSSGCGASTEFLIPGYNGYMFQKGNRKSLLAALERFTGLSDDELALYASRSALMGQRINTEQNAASLMSVLYL